MQNGHHASSVQNDGLYTTNLSTLTRTLKSTDDTINITIDFINQSRDNIEIFWINYDGDVQNYGNIPSGQNYVQDSCTTWPWLVKQAGKDICIYIPQDSFREDAKICLYVHDNGNVKLGGDAASKQNRAEISVGAHHQSSRNIRSSSTDVSRDYGVSSHHGGSIVAGRSSLRNSSYRGNHYEGNTSSHLISHPEVVTRGSIHREKSPKRVDFRVERPNYNETYVEKTVDCIIEKPVPREVYVDVPYDVHVERPVEKIINKEVIHEVYVDRIIDKIVEVHVEKVVEVYIDKEVEIPIYIDEYHDVPVEKIFIGKIASLG